MKPSSHGSRRGVKSFRGSAASIGSALSRLRIVQFVQKLNLVRLIPADRSFARLWLVFIIMVGASCWASLAAELGSDSALSPAALPSLEEVLNSNLDLWGEAALREPDGPSYEFFARLLPPPRYVNADFHDYPIVLSAPRGPVKARLISNGRGLNLPGGSRSWNDAGVPVIFRVGPDELRFGQFPQRVTEPRYAEGWLPIVQVDYEHGEAVYREEAFASVDQSFSPHGIVLIQFSLARGNAGNVSVQIDARAPLQVSNGAVRNGQGQTIVWFDSHWKWARSRLTATLSSTTHPALAVATRPAAASLESPLNGSGYNGQRQRAMEIWSRLLSRGMDVNVPETVVNHAWRALIAGTFSLIHSNRMHYSAGNQYDRLYEAEGGDATQALLVWGFADTVRELIPPLLDFTRAGLEFHQAGHKLQLLTHYYALTRHAEFVRRQRPRWEKELRRILDGRTNEHGLFPREQYCGDVATPVFSLNSNAKAWRAIRDFAPMLSEVDELQLAQSVRVAAAEFRARILAAIEKSERRDIEPPFFPIALFGEETPYEKITTTKIGSYWNLMANYVLGAGVFGPGAAREELLLEYQRRRGGLCMGLIRSRPNPTFWTGPHSINPLYGLRHVLTVLQRDEPDRALVSFYGLLAQGMTRDTFIGGEGCSLMPLDERGRLFYCPPNSASNGFFLWMLRSLLIQDWDLDDNGKPETLRLLFATPRRWLEDGQTISVLRAPTAFGEVSLRVQSRLNQGEVLAEIDLPQRQHPARTLLRLRMPKSWRVASARAGERLLPIDGGETIDLSGLTGKVSLRCSVGRIGSAR